MNVINVHGEKAKIMFREIILPMFRSTRLCVTACGTMHPRCCWSVASKRRDSASRLPASNIVSALYHKL